LIIRVGGDRNGPHATPLHSGPSKDTS
jgi:hypothetical protein